MCLSIVVSKKKSRLMTVFQYAVKVNLRLVFNVKPIGQNKGFYLIDSIYFNSRQQTPVDFMKFADVFCLCLDSLIFVW